MGKLEMLRIFCAAAEASSFREAAAHLAVSPQAVTRVVKDLEDQRGEVLFHRNTRKIQITSYGAEFAVRAKAAIGSVDALLSKGEANVRGRVEGVVRLTAPGMLGRGLMMRSISQCLIENPALRVDLRLSEARADAVEGQIDVGVRIGTVRDSRFVSRPVAKAKFHVVASNSLLKRTGIPLSIDELSRHPLTSLVNRNSGRAWPWEFSQKRSLNPVAVFVTDDPEAECEATLAGVGFSQLPSHIAVPHLRSGRLVSVLDSVSPAPWQLSVYRARRSPVPARVRLLFDHLIATFGAVEM